MSVTADSPEWLVYLYKKQMSTVSSYSASEPTGIALLTHEYRFDLSIAAQGEVRVKCNCVLCVAVNVIPRCVLSN
jgi:hypothetical protein